MKAIFETGRSDNGGGSGGRGGGAALVIIEVGIRHGE